MTDYKKEAPQRKKTSNETIEAYLSDLLFRISLIEKSDKHDIHPTFFKTMQDIILQSWDLVPEEDNRISYYLNLAEISYYLNLAEERIKLLHPGKGDGKLSREAHSVIVCLDEIREILKLWPK